MGKGKIDVQDVKEKLFLMGITAGIFLPIRMLFVTYVTDDWIGSIGLLSAFGLGFIYLTQKKKLGQVGKIFEKQMRKTIGGKIGKYIVVFSVVFLIYFGASIFFMDRGNSVYYYDKEILFSTMQEYQQLTRDNIPIEKLLGPVPLTKNIDSLSWLSNVEYTLSVSLALMNDFSGGWMENLMFVVFVEQFEVIGILYFFRRRYKPPKQTPDIIV
ncbi:MAG TPA: hypothetical protein VFG25_05735 [Nitrosopumilaceae archaeon]|nr:hypothetical protein [Nitrosopumilaceae archaeon]